MGNNTTFRCPEPFVPFSDEEGILSATGVDWFATLLRRIPSLEVDPKYCQEDWGVVILVSRNQKKFWIGLSIWPEGDGAWLAHVHHSSFAWLQRFTSTGRKGFERLIIDLDRQLTTDPKISDVIWHREDDMQSAAPGGSKKPDEK
jgi:hypothetical protein